MQEDDRMDKHKFPYWTLFKSQVPDLSEPDSEGWATGLCPYCGEPDTFRVNLKSGRWVCLPKPPQMNQGASPAEVKQ